MKSNARIASQDTRRHQQPTNGRVDLTDTLSAEEVGNWLGVHRDEVIRKATAGDLPSVLIGRRRRFPRAWVRWQLANERSVTVVTEDLINVWLTTRRSRASEPVRETYRAPIRRFVEWLGAHAVAEGKAPTVDDFSRRNVERWQEWIVRSQLRPCNWHIAIVQAFMRWLHDEQFITEISRVDASIRTLESAPGIDDLSEILTALPRLMADVPAQAIPHTALDGWAARILRALNRPLRRYHREVTGGLLVDAYRSLPTTPSRLEFLENRVWPGPVPRAEKLLLYRHVARTTRSRQLREWLASKEDSRRDTEIKGILLGSEAKAILSHLLPDHSVVSEATFPRLLHRLARRCPDTAARVLAKRIQGYGPSGRVVGMGGKRGGGIRRGARVREETLPELLGAGRETRQTTMDLLSEIELVS